MPDDSAEPVPSAGGRRCSARGCRAEAVEDLVWRNPRLHTGDRRRHWLACPAHADHLAGFLAARGFLLDRQALPGA